VSGGALDSTHSPVATCSAVTVSIIGFAVSFGQLKKIKTTVYGQFHLLWCQMFYHVHSNFEN